MNFSQVTTRKIDRLAALELQLLSDDTLTNRESLWAERNELRESLIDDMEKDFLADTSPGIGSIVPGEVSDELYDRAEELLKQQDAPIPVLIVSVALPTADGNTEQYKAVITALLSRPYVAMKVIARED